MRVIGLHGKAQSGKDTTCDIIKDWGANFHYTVERDAFADRLKISAARALGFEGDDYECIMFCDDLKFAGEIKVEWDQEALDESPSVTTSWDGWSITGRQYLQLYGTEAHREVFDTDFWIKQVTEQERDCDILVITDVRFPNEAEAIRQMGGEVWQIVRGGSGAGNHASEKAISNYLIDLVISNNGSLAGLRKSVFACMETELEVR